MSAQSVVLCSCISSILLLTPNSISADWKVITNNHMNSENLFSVRDIKKGIEEEAGYYFPIFFPGDSVITTGLLLTKSSDIPIELKTGLSSNTESYMWTYSFPNPLRCTTDKSVLYQRLYVEDVLGYSVYIHSSITEEWFRKDFSIPFNRYQVPKINRMASWIGERTGQPEDSQSQTYFLDSKKQANVIDKVAILVFPRSKDFKFVVGDFKISNLERSTIEYHHPLFDPIVEKNSNRLISHDIFSISDQLPVVTAPLYMRSTKKSGSTTFYIVPEKREELNQSSLRKLKQDIISRILDVYPFYDIHNINKYRVLSRFKDICKVPLESNKAFEDSLRQLVLDFNDVHFDVQSRSRRSPTRYVSPVALYEIVNDVYIAAVFDTLLTHLVGNRIVSIDDVPIQNAILDEIRIKRHKGSDEVRKRKALNTVLKRQKHEEVEIRMRTERGDFEEVSIRYDRDVVIPPNFVPSHGDFKVLEGDLAYFRIARWTPDIWVRFLNHSEQIRKSNGIIFDLRSNRGGDIRVVIRMISTLINQPVVYGHLVTPADGRKESMIVYPHPVFNFTQSIIILANNRTACASEDFIDVLRNAGKAHLLSSTRTQGSDSAMINIILPDGFKIFTNTWMIRLTASGESIESSGIEPDYWVSIDNINDLAHREDKLCKVATEILRKRKRHQ